MPPSESPYHIEDGYKNLQSEILHFQALGSVLIMGDLNARTGREMDYVSAEGSFHSCSETPLYPTQVTTQRQRYDSVVNKNGKQTLHLCKGLGLYIVNGRTRGDSLGRYTYSSVLGSSVVDYAVTDMDPEHINAFIVLPQTPHHNI